MNAATQQTIAHFIFEGFTTLDMYGPVQAFASCREPDGEGGWHRRFEQFTVGMTTGPVTSGEGPSTQAKHGFSEAPDFDILLIPGGFGTRAAVSDNRLLRAVDELCDQAKVVATVCTGSALLARTGRLDGRPATSNKIAWDWVLTQGPKVNWRRQARWVDDGDIITSSGVSAGIDMTLNLIARLIGRDSAQKSAGFMEYIWNRDPGNDPFA